MPSKRESILAAIATTLVGTTGVSTRIYCSRVEAFARNEAPALVIEPGTDSASEELVSNCKIDWRLPVLSGWHVNYAGEHPKAWEKFLVTPQHPARVWA